MDGFSNRATLAALAGSAVVGQVVVFASTPILSRLYSPSQFAVFSVFSAVAAVLMVFPALRLELRVPIEPTDSDARQVALAAIQCSVTFAVSGTAAIGGFSIFATIVWPDWQLGRWTWLVPTAAALTAAVAVTNQWAVRLRKFRAISIRNVTRNTMMVALQIALGAVWDSAGGLLCGFILANFITVVTMGRSLDVRLRDLVPTRISSATICRLRWFSIKLVISGFFNFAGVQIPIVLFAVYYSPDLTGQFGMAQRILLLPVAILGMAVGQLFLADFSEATRTGSDSRKIFMSSTLRLLAFAVPVAIVAASLGRVVVPWLLGPGWEVAGVFVALLAVGASAQLVASPLSQVLVVLGKLRLQLGWDLGRLIAVAGVVVICGEAKSDVGATVAALSATIFLSYVVQWFVSYLAVAEYGLDQTLRSNPEAVA